MVELTVSTVLRRSAAVLRRQQSLTRCLSLSKAGADVRQNRQAASAAEVGGKSKRDRREEAADAADDTVRRADDSGVGRTPSLCTDSKKKIQDCADDLRLHVTHIIANGEEIDTLQEGLARRLPNVEVVYLLDNRLSDIRGLALWSHLRRVYLQNNSIQSLRGVFDTLASLEELNVDSNCIERLEGLTACTKLTRLSLANQRTPRPLTFDEESLQALSKSLRILDVSKNRTEDLRSIAALEALESLDASANDVQRLGVIGTVLAGCRRLKTLSFHDNPVSRTPRVREYLRYVLVHASAELSELDGKEVTDVQRAFIQDMHRYLERPLRQRSRAGECSKENEAAVVS